MLQHLSYWRGQCSAEQLTEFETELAVRCDAAISKATIKNRYSGSYHKALINSKVLKVASTTEQFALRPPTRFAKLDDGIELTRKLAQHHGFIVDDKLNAQETKAAALLLQRGIIFKHNGFYCLPAEFLIDLRGDGAPNDWLTLASNTPAAMLHQIIPGNAQATMLQPKASHNEMVAWLIVNGEQARKNQLADQLNESDWSLLLLLQNCDLEGFDSLKKRYADLPAIEVTRHYYYNDKQEFSPRKALEKHLPAQIIKLYRLGLIGIITCSGDNITASITLCSEAENILEPHLKIKRKRIAAHLKKQWQATPCHAEDASAWTMDQDIWRLWATLHFMPLGITQQGKLRKNDLKKIAILLHKDHPEKIEFFIFSMLKSGLIEQQGSNLTPCSINWKNWQQNMRTHICRNIRTWDGWDKLDEKQALNLLAQLPLNCWLKLDEVIEWLRTQSKGGMVHANWISLFTLNQSAALHHLNLSQRSIYLLPEFRAVIKQQAITFPAPGWHGANKKAKVSGFISAAGEIQLPPDCNHKVLGQLARYCTITAIEQMITLQLDDKAIQRMGTDKAALKKTRRLLESLQSPLPQAIAYMFDKQQSQTAIAQVASTAMVVLLNDVSAIHRLQKTGFEFSQPFKDKPEIVLLDASADALAFCNACNEAGILLETLIKPVQWISGTAAVNAWMDINIDREDQWLEISYQKTRSTKPKQVIARIDADYYGAIRVQPARKTKQRYALLKSTVQLQPKHVLRLRELDDTEVTELGLDTL